MEIKRMQDGNQPYKVTIYGGLCSVERFAGTLDDNDDQYMVHNGMVLQKIPPEEFRIDTSLIPDHVCNDLASATLDFVCRMMADPEAREKVEARIRAKKALQQK